MLFNFKRKGKQRLAVINIEVRNSEPLIYYTLYCIRVDENKKRFLNIVESRFFYLYQDQKYF